MKHNQYEVISHGVESRDYFQGCGSGTFDHVYTGIGDNERSALEDAIEQAYASLSDVSLPTRFKGINAKNRLPQRCGDDVYFYVSIRINDKK